MAKEKLLIIEDEASVAKQLKWSLEAYDISIAGDAQKARQLLASGAFPVATLDLGLPPSSDTPYEGFKLLEALGSLAPHTKVIVITGNAEQENAVKAVALGAADFCVKPIDLDILKIILSRTFRLYTLEETNRRLRERKDAGGSLCGMLGISPQMQHVFSMIRKVSETDYPVLITGESGTGKEMVAHAIHRLSKRCQKPFVIINCGAIPENLLESELFGHEKGAFTGAVARKTGKLEQGEAGTVFLDEIGELPFSMQVKILRYLQEGTIERVGGKSTIALDTRIIAATNIDLQQAVQKGNFREDLYFRLNVLPIHLPPLRERPEDIMLLAQHFLGAECASLKAGRILFSQAAMAALPAEEWPGNVRELQNRIRRALSNCSGQRIMPEDLGLAESRMAQGEEKFRTLQEARDQAEEKCIRKALMMTGNNISQAAKLLGISRPTLHDLLKKHKIK
ncbi:MAG: PEP-CTERM-box response regulator transcription factor [Desulfobacterales bacterium]|nr:PEP-CTERM-box response regulator transcription factor [Desulfobacterales bacterium]